VAGVLVTMFLAAALGDNIVGAALIARLPS
jgi:hypothetical protein